MRKLSQTPSGVRRNYKKVIGIITNTSSVEKRVLQLEKLGFELTKISGRNIHNKELYEDGGNYYVVVGSRNKNRFDDKYPVVKINDETNSVKSKQIKRTTKKSTKKRVKKDYSLTTMVDTALKSSNTIKPPLKSRKSVDFQEYSPQDNSGIDGLINKEVEKRIGDVIDRNGDEIISRKLREFLTKKIG